MFSLSHSLSLSYTLAHSGAINLTREEFATTAAPTVVTNVACTGTENKLTDCSYSSETTCGLLNDAGIVCQGTYII